MTAVARLAVTSMVVVGTASLPRVTGGGELEAREAPLYAATLVYVADRLGCTTRRPCCYSVQDQVPSAELVGLLESKRRLKPITAHDACVEWTIDVGRIPPYGPNEQHVASSVGGEGAPFLFCNHVLALVSGRWVVDPKRDLCPVM